MPHTIKDWPRRQSPAAKTPSTLVEYFWIDALTKLTVNHSKNRHTLGGVWILDLASCFKPRPLMTSDSGPKKPNARNTS